MKMFRFVDIYRFVSVADATEDANGCRHSERTGQFVSGSGKRDSPITRPKVETNSESVEEDLGPTCARTDTLTPSSYCCH